VVREAELGGQVRPVAAVLPAIDLLQSDHVGPQAGHRVAEPGEIHPAVPR
jgi:hypothetical protein